MSTPVKIILDTDMGPDSDDAGTLGMLNALADLGEAEIAAVVTDITCAWAAPCVSAINVYYGRADVPVGMLNGHGPSGTTPGWSGTAYNRAIAEQFPTRFRGGARVPDALDILRAALAGLPQGSKLKLVGIGSLNNFLDLLDSRADSFSSLSGVELIRARVDELVIMGGRYPHGEPECNFAYDPAAAQRVCRDWPAP